MNLVTKLEEKYLKKSPELRPGDTVRVHQKIREGAKERIQVFEGVVLKVKGGGIKTTFLVRKISFNVGVEKSFLLHSPNIAKIEIRKRAKVRQAYLTYLRALRGKKARLKDMQFDALAVNVKDEPIEEAEPVTDLPVEEAGAQPIEVVPLEEVEKAEEAEASRDEMNESGETEEGPAGSDEQAAQIAEIEEGLNKADAEAEKGKATEGERAEEATEDITAEDLKEEVAQEQEDNK